MPCLLMTDVKSKDCETKILLEATWQAITPDVPTDLIFKVLVRQPCVRMVWELTEFLTAR